MELNQLHECSEPAASMWATLPISIDVLNHRGRVVIAEDDADMRTFLRLVLQKAGFEVDALEDGTAALAACKERVPDLVVADLTMPGLGGFELIARLRSDELTAVIPVLILSGRSDEDSRILGIAAGADDYLVKPIGSRELVARVEGALRLARLRLLMAQRQQGDFESLFSTAFDAVIVLNSREEVLTTNARAQQLFGYSAREFSGLLMATLLPTDHFEDRSGDRQSIWRNSCDGPTRPYLQLQCRRADGSQFIAEIGQSEVHFRNQACLVLNVRDITERIQAQLKLETTMERLRALSERLTVIQEEERHKIAFELHEQLGQELCTLNMHLEMLEKAPNKKSEEHRTDALMTVRLMLERVRSMALDLRPPQLDDLGLSSALYAHCRRQEAAAQWTLHFDITNAGARSRSEVEIACFRIVQEALTNITRHASATEVWLRLYRSENQLLLSLRDNGVGFDATESRSGRPASSLGLIGMAERMRQVGGRLEIESSSPGGTEIRAVFPCAEDAGADSR